MWATEPHADLPVKMGTTGVAAKEPSTVFKVFQKTVENHGESPALKFKDASNVSFFLFLAFGRRFLDEKARPSALKFKDTSRGELFFLFFLFGFRFLGEGPPPAGGRGAWGILRPPPL